MRLVNVPDILFIGLSVFLVTWGINRGVAALGHPNLAA
jgi:hypothetical protein